MTLSRLALAPTVLFVIAVAVPSAGASTTVGGTSTSGSQLGSCSFVLPNSAGADSASTSVFGYVSFRLPGETNSSMRTFGWKVVAQTGSVDRVQGTILATDSKLGEDRARVHRHQHHRHPARLAHGVRRHLFDGEWDDPPAPHLAGCDHPLGHLLPVDVRGWILDQVHGDCHGRREPIPFADGECPLRDLLRCWGRGNVRPPRRLLAGFGPLHGAVHGAR